MATPSVVQSVDVEEAAFRPMVSPGRGFWPLVAVLGLLVLGAVVAFAYQTVSGLQVAGYADDSFWGIYEADLVAFIGVSYGGALVSAILRLTNATWRAPLTRIAEATALVSLLVGATFAVIHLGRPDRVLGILLTPNASSPIVWDFLAISTYLLATLIFLYLPLVPDLARVRDRRRPGSLGRRLYAGLALDWHGAPEQRRRLRRGIGVLAVLIIPLAVSVHSVLAFSFSMTMRPGWHSTIFAPYFVVGALYSGVALVIVAIAAFRRAYRLEALIGRRHLLSLGRIMIALGLVYLYLTFSDLLTGAYTRTADEAAIVDSVLEGRFAPFFWLFLAAGVGLPIALVALPSNRRTGAIVAAGVLAVGGMWLKRLLITVPSATMPQFDGPWGSFTVTWVPALVTIGAAAAIPLGLLILFRFVPLLDLDEIEEAATAMEARRPVVDALEQPASA